MKNITLVLPVEQVNKIIAILTERPFKEVNEIIAELIKQGNEQVNKQPDAPVL